MKQGMARIVGKLLPGSRARIIKIGNDDGWIKDPYDNSVNWISKIQVGQTLMQKLKNYETCISFDDMK